MRFKSILKSGLLFGLAIVMTLSMFACKDDNRGSMIDKDGFLPNQEDNIRYYFQQGYRNDWKIVKMDPQGYRLDTETDFVMQLAPTDAKENDDGTWTEGNVIDGVEYTIYAYKTLEHSTDKQKINMTSTPSEVVGWLTKEDNDFYFNNRFYVDSPRDTFMQRPDVTTYTAKYSKLQFLQISYTFTRDGEDWRGIYNFVMKGQDFFVITFEAKADLFDTYEPEYIETVGDFRKTGWETSNV